MYYNTEGQITKNFKLEEFTNTKAAEECKLQTSPEFFDLVFMLQELRNWWTSYFLGISCNQFPTSTWRNCILLLIEPLSGV